MWKCAIAIFLASRIFGSMSRNFEVVRAAETAEVPSVGADVKVADKPAPPLVWGWWSTEFDDQEPTEGDTEEAFKECLMAVREHYSDKARKRAKRQRDMMVLRMRACHKERNKCSKKYEATGCENFFGRPIRPTKNTRASRANCY